MSVERGTERKTVAWLAVACYLAVAYLGMWALCIPFWLNENGLRVGWAGLVLVVAMWVPALASWVTCRFVTHESWPRRVGLTMRLRGRAGTTPTWAVVLRYSGLAIAVFLGFFVVVAVADALLGLPTDPSLGGYLERTRSMAAVGSIPDVVLLAGFALNVILGLLLINPAAALGEEIGWRGWLYPALLPLGRVRAVVLTGVIWGLWHAPIMLIGYNYPTLPGWVATLAFIVPCVLLSVVLGWLRTASGSVVPAAYGHGAFNAFAGLAVGALPAAEVQANTVLYGLFGVVGVVIGAVLIAAAMFVRRRDA